MARTPRILGKLIDAADIGARITHLKSESDAVAGEAHLIGVSALAIAARDGQISPLNSFREAMPDTMAKAFKAYCLVHCRTWLTMIEGEYRVKPDRETERQDFMTQNVAAMMRERFTDRREEQPPGRAPRGITDTAAIKKVGRLLAQLEDALEHHAEGVSGPVVEEFRLFCSKVKKAQAKVERKGRGRPAAPVEALPRH